jgi:acyl carrier protein
MQDQTSIEAKLKSYILEEFLAGEDPDELQESTELMTTGILDSIGTLKLVTFLENEFGVQLEPHETDAEYLNTIGDISRLVRSKRGEG